MECLWFYPIGKVVGLGCMSSDKGTYYCEIEKVKRVEAPVSVHEKKSSTE